jgi:hypothetical protein
MRKWLFLETHNILYLDLIKNNIYSNFNFKENESNSPIFIILINIINYYKLFNILFILWYIFRNSYQFIQPLEISYTFQNLSDLTSNNKHLKSFSLEK